MAAKGKKSGTKPVSTAKLAARSVRPEVSARFNEALALHQAGKVAEARVIYEAILAVDPDHSDSLHLLGMAKYAAGEVAEALGLIGRAVKLQPKADIYLGNYGNVLRSAGRIDEAIESYRAAITANPKNPTPYSNLGNAYSDLGRLEEAVAQYEKALQLKPDFYETLFNLALVLRSLRRFDEAIAHLRRATALFPQLAEAHYTLGQTLLLHGDLGEGWKEYDWRWRLGEYEWLKNIHGEFMQPRWEGEPIQGKTVLVYAEQGMGDALQFVRYLPRLVERGGKVVFAVHPRLIRVLGHMPGVQVAPLDQVPLPAFDFHSPLLSLPRVLGITSVPAIPRQDPYLKAEPMRVAFWKQRLAAMPGFKIGIAWQGNPNAKIDKGRSPPLAAFAPLAAVPGVTLVSLQQRDGLDQLDRLPAGMKVERLGDGVDEVGAFVDTAAIMECLDLLIVSDSAIAHLAGALGRPVWLPLKLVPDWRFLLEGEDCPWYASMRLFRQTRDGDWLSVFQTMAATLAERIGAVPPPSAPEKRGSVMASANAAPSAATSMPLVPQSWGEIIDKITILEIKSERLSDPAKLANVRRELDELAAVRERHFPAHAGLAGLSQKLKKVNEALWVIEDDIRDCERAKDFGKKFIDLARAVYVTNDQRAAVKREINDLLGSALVEEKSYAAYTDDLAGASKGLVEQVKKPEATVPSSPPDSKGVSSSGVSLLSPYMVGAITASAQGVFASYLEDQFVGRSLRERGTYGSAEIDLASRFLKPGDQALVVGAHIGTIAVALAQRCAGVTAFEANPQSFRLFQCNLALNGLRNVDAHNLAVSDKSERLRFVLSRHNSGGSKRYPKVEHPMYFYDQPDVVEVDAVALDPFLGSRDYALVFMDIEGSEYYALRGMPRLLSRTRALFVEFIPHHLQNVSGVSPEEFASVIAPHFELLFIPGLSAYVERANFGAMLRRLYDLRLAQEQVIFAKAGLLPDIAALAQGGSSR